MEILFNLEVEIRGETLFESTENIIEIIRNYMNGKSKFCLNQFIIDAKIDCHITPENISLNKGEYITIKNITII